MPGRSGGARGGGRQIGYTAGFTRRGRPPLRLLTKDRSIPLRKITSLAAIAAALLVLLTLAIAWSKQGRKRDPLEPPPQTRSVEAHPPASQRCAIVHAHFGGRRAQIVRVMHGEVSAYIVIDLGRHDPLARLQRSDWVRATYGGGDQTWLGEFGSAAAALRRASRLCPPGARCWPGEPGCSSPTDPLTPVQAFAQGLSLPSPEPPSSTASPSP